MVGGPLLGLFSLGMFLPLANTSGAISGFTTSMLLLFWMSFGQPRPKVEHLPLSTDHCPASLMNRTDFQDFSNSSGIVNLDDDDVHYLHKISYAWYTFIGWNVVMLVGTLVSVIVNKISKPDPVNPDLMADPVRNYLLKNRLGTEEELQPIEKIFLDEPEM